mgnify:CR=1 FL=1
MLHEEAGAEAGDKALYLVDADRITQPDIDSAALLEGSPAVDADKAAVHVEEGAAGIAGID